MLVTCIVKTDEFAKIYTFIRYNFFEISYCFDNVTVNLYI